MRRRVIFHFVVRQHIGEQQSHGQVVPSKMTSSGLCEWLRTSLSSAS